MAFLGNLVRGILTSVITRYAFLFVSAVLLPFSLRHPVLAAAVLAVLAAAGYLLFTYQRQGGGGERRD